MRNLNLFEFNKYNKLFVSWKFQCFISSFLNLEKNNDKCFVSWKFENFILSFVIKSANCLFENTWEKTSLIITSHPRLKSDRTEWNSNRNWMQIILCTCRCADPHQKHIRYSAFSEFRTEIQSVSNPAVVRVLSFFNQHDKTTGLKYYHSSFCLFSPSRRFVEL